MNMKYTRAEKAEALRRAVIKYSPIMTDKALAIRYGFPVARVTKARQRLGIAKVGRRPKSVHVVV